MADIVYVCCSPRENTLVATLSSCHGCGPMVTTRFVDDTEMSSLARCNTAKTGFIFHPFHVDEKSCTFFTTKNLGHGIAAPELLLGTSVPLSAMMILACVASGMLKKQLERTTAFCIELMAPTIA